MGDPKVRDELVLDKLLLTEKTTTVAEMGLGSIVGGVLLLLQAWQRQKSAEVITANSTAYSVTFPADPIEGGDCFPSCCTGGAPATRTGVLVDRFKKIKF